MDETLNNRYSQRDMQIIKAYLVEEKSYRTIEKEIMKIDSPDRGGGYMAKVILNSYGISGKHKGLLRTMELNEAINQSTGLLKDTLKEMKNVNKNFQ